MRSSSHAETDPTRTVPASVQQIFGSGQKMNEPFRDGSKERLEDSALTRIKRHLGSMHRRPQSKVSSFCAAIQRFDSHACRI